MWKDVCTFTLALCKLLWLPSLGSEGLIGTRSACSWHHHHRQAPPSSSLHATNSAISSHTPMDTDSQNNWNWKSLQRTDQLLPSCPAAGQLVTSVARTTTLQFHFFYHVPPPYHRYHPALAPDTSSIAVFDHDRSYITCWVSLISLQIRRERALVSTTSQPCCTLLLSWSPTPAVLIWRS